MYYYIICVRFIQLEIISGPLGCNRDSISMPQNKNERNIVDFVDLFVIRCYNVHLFSSTRTID